MKRSPLAGFPVFGFPAPYQFRWYLPGDEAHWLTIHHKADIHSEQQATMATFRRAFGEDTAVLAQRQGYILDGAGQPIGTASAWFDPVDENGRLPGRVHWVAILPEHQGKGLAKPLLSIICQRLEKFDHPFALLETSTARIPAVNLYLRFGFTPHIRNDVDRDAWEQLRPYLKYP